MRIKFVVVFVLAFLASAVPASAQYGYGGCDRLQQIYYGCDSLRQVMSQNRQLINYAGYQGYMDNGYFYGVADQYGHPLSRPVRIAVGAGIGASIGGGIGDLLGGHGGAGALIGLGVGALIGAKTGGHHENQVVVTPPPQQGVYWNRGMPVAVGTRAVPPTAMPPAPVESQLEWKFFRNEFEKLEVRVHIVGHPDQDFSLSPGSEETKQLSTGARILAEALIWKGSRQVPSQDLGQRELPQHSGWAFYSPVS